MDIETTAEVIVPTRKEAFTDRQRLLLEKRMRGASSKNPEDGVTSRPRDSRVPLSAEQKRIWLHAAQQPALSIYNEPITIYRKGSFDLGILTASLNEIVRRHEAWRTSFTAEGEAIVSDALSVELPFVDLSSHPDPDKEAVRIATEDAQKPFALDVLPLFRALVVKMSPDEHRLYLTLHHIIFDGVSLSRILLPELAAIYAAFEEGRGSLSLPPVLQYGDYAIWRERQLQSPETKKHLSYWATKLAGELPVLRLPIDSPRSPNPTHRGSMERFEIPLAVMENLKHLSHVCGVTLYTTLFTAFQVLLFRYSGQDDLIVGTATDARRRPELERVMGYFLDTVAIRTHPTPEITFLEYLAQTQDTLLEAFGAAAVPFDRVVHEVNPKRDRSHHPIFQAFFSMRPTASEDPPGWKMAHLDVTVEASKFDIYLELGELSDRIEGRVLYNLDIFEGISVRAITKHFLTLLEAICDQPNVTLGHVRLLAPAEAEALLGTDGWNGTSESIPSDSVQQLIEGRAKLNPTAIAAQCGTASVTYEGLLVRSAELGSMLFRVGVRRGSLVAIALERSIDLLAGILAILRIGAAYLPLDISMPQERIRLCLSDALPAAVLTQRSVLPLVSQPAMPVVLVDDKHGLLADTDENRSALLHEKGHLEDTAYVIYTSGTTGVPKAVEITQRSLVNLLASMQSEPGFTSSDVLLAITAISFDISALELLLPLICGGKVIMATREETQDPELLGMLIDTSGCTVVQATPSTWRTLLRSGWRSEQDNAKANYPRLRLLSGGEALTGGLARELLTTGADVWNMYGPTETTIWSLVNHVREQHLISAHSVSVGHPIANTQAYILDPQLQLVPIGVQGELFLGGVGLAKGYRGRTELTADRFVRVEAVGGDRLYRTGDLAVRSRDGMIQVVGRNDHQVKVRGHRLELEAVEAFVTEHPQVSAVAARTWPEASGDLRLVIYVVVKDNAPLTLSHLRDFLSTRVPDWMIPSSLYILPEMPVTANGKINRFQLPAPSVLGSPVPDGVNDLSPDESRLHAMWCELLGRDVIGPDEDFFSLGGHSLLVAALQQKIKIEFGCKVAMASLFHQPTIRQHAQLVVGRDDKEAPILPPGVLLLQDQGSEQPLFWIHYANNSLAAAVGPDQPFYSVVLTADDLVALGSSPTLESIAICHMQKILAIQSKGPYRIGGFCVGGVVAYEIARLLRKANHHVSNVVLVDTPNPNSSEVKKFFRFIRWVLGDGGIKAVTYAVNKRIDDHRRSKLSATPVNEMRTAQEILEVAASRYHPGKYDGSLLLIQASDRLHMDLEPAWKEVVKRELATQYVDGHHDDLMKAENVVDVGEVISGHLVAKARYTGDTRKH